MSDENTPEDQSSDDTSESPEPTESVWGGTPQPDDAPETEPTPDTPADALDVDTPVFSAEPPTAVSPIVEESGSKKLWLYAGIAAAAVLIGLAALSWATGRAKGIDDAALQAIPADAPIVISIDLAEVVDGGRFERLFNTIGAQLPADVEGPRTWEELLVASDDQGGVSLKSDVLPWLGRSSAIAFFPTDGGNSVDFVTVVAVRDRDAAKAFIDKSTADQGTTATTVDAGLEWSDDTGVFLLTDDLVMYSETRTKIDAALAAIDGESIADVSNYRDAVAELPDSRFFTAYLDTDAMTSLFIDSLGGNLGGLPGGVDPSILKGLGDLAQNGDLGGIAFGATLFDNGLAFDFVMNGFGSMPVFVNNLPRISSLPDGTLAYGSISLNGKAILDQVDQQLGGAAIPGIGIDPSTELVAGVTLNELLLSIDGPLQLLVTGDASLIGVAAGVDIAGALSIGLADTAPINKILDFAVNSDQFGFGLFEEDGMYNFGGGSFAASFGVVDDAFVAGTSRELVDALTKGEAIGDPSETFTAVKKMIDGDNVFLFADLAQIAKLADNRDFTRFSEIATAVGGSITQTDSSFGGRFVVLLDY
ncbi:MAG: DUF3352 domain-containing protein [Actinobacteria bacterium]|nr:DUF3352 domain-containing protein [Actinomycetota bacterium]